MNSPRSRLWKLFPIYRREPPGRRPRCVLRRPLRSRRRAPGRPCPLPHSGRAGRGERRRAARAAALGLHCERGRTSSRRLPRWGNPTSSVVAVPRQHSSSATRPPSAADHHPLQPEPPIGIEPFALRVVKRERALFDVEYRRIAFGADSQRAQRRPADRARGRHGDRGRRVEAFIPSAPASRQAAGQRCAGRGGAPRWRCGPA